MKTLSNSPTPRLVWLLGLGLFFSTAAAQAQDVLPPQDYWVGSSSSTDYAVPANWSLRRVPSAGDNVIIRKVGDLVPVMSMVNGMTVTTQTPVVNQPTINQLGTANTLTVDQNATLTIGALGNLNLYGNLITNGTLVGNGSITTLGTTLHTIDGTASGTGGVLTVNDLLVSSSPGAILTTPLRINRLLSLTGNLTTTTAGPLTLLSATGVTGITSFVVNNPGVVIGTVTMQRAIDNSINPGLGYRHYSAPVSNTTVADLTTSGFTPVLTQSYNTSPTPPATVPFPTVYGYDQTLVNRTNTSPDFDKGFFVPAALTSPLVPGRGYTANLNGSQLEDFVGTLNNGDITPAMQASATAAGATGNLYRSPSSSLNSASAGYQFLGNPYPAPIDFRLFFSADPTVNAFTGTTPTATTTVPTTYPIYQTLYVYYSTSQYGGMYRTYSAASGIGNPIIPSGQGFMVRIPSSLVTATTGYSANFTFRNGQRLTTSDNTTFQRSALDTRPQLELTLGTGGAPMLDVFNLVFHPGSTTADNDQYDALKAPNQNNMSLNSTTPSGEALAIDARPLATGETIIPLHVAVAEDGTYTLRLSSQANMGGLYAYLRDKQAGTLTNLSQQTNYPFTTSTTANNTARFELVVSPQPLAAAPAALAKQVALYPNPAKASVSLELPASLGAEAIRASFIDALGRTVRTVTLPAQGSTAHQLDLHGLAPGVYALRLSTSAGTIVNRLAVE